VPRRTAVTETVKVGLAAVRREPYVLFGRHRHRAVARALREEITTHRPDVMYLDHLDSLVYADVHEQVPLVIDMHNVYSRLASRAAAEARGAVRRRYLESEAALIARMELRAAGGPHDPSPRMMHATLRDRGEARSRRAERRRLCCADRPGR
jgi:hypothetical protein